MNTLDDGKTVEELILDYACRNYMDDVTGAIANHRGQSAFSGLNVPHLRIVVATLSSIVRRECIADFDEALQMLDVVCSAVPDALSDKQYVRLTTRLKTEIILHKLSQGKFDYADVVSTLNRYFPRSKLKTSGVSQQDVKLNSYQLHYRQLLTRLMLSQSKREAYVRGEMDAELGPSFRAGIQHLMRKCADTVNQLLSTPVIEEIISEGPQSQISRDLQDTQSDSLDQLLAAAFQGPPSQDVLMSILKASWDEEEVEKMEISDCAGACDGYMSAEDIFEDPIPAADLLKGASDPGTCSREPSSGAQHLRSSSGPQRLQREEANVEERRPSETPAHTSQEQPSDAEGQDISCPDDKTVRVEAGSGKTPDLTPSAKHPSQPSEDHTTPAAFVSSDNTRWDNLDHKWGTPTPLNELSSVPAENPSLDEDSAAHIVLDTSVSIQTALEPQTVPGQNPLTSRESDPMPSFIPDSPKQATPMVAFQMGGCAKLAVQPRSPSVSKSRIYQSKCGQQSQIAAKRTKLAAVCRDSFVRLLGSQLYDPPLSQSYKSCLGSLDGSKADSDSEIYDTQISTSSDGSQSSSDKSSTSVSLLSGLRNLRHFSKHPHQTAQPVTTIMEEVEEVMSLTMSNPFEDTVISDIEVYPVTRLKAHRRLPSRPRNSYEVDNEQETSETPKMAEQDNTVSSSDSPVLGTETTPNLDLETTPNLVEPTTDTSQSPLVILRRLSQDPTINRFCDFTPNLVERRTTPNLIAKNTTPNLETTPNPGTRTTPSMRGQAPRDVRVENEGLLDPRSAQETGGQDRRATRTERVASPLEKKASQGPLVVLRKLSQDPTIKGFCEFSLESLSSEQKDGSLEESDTSSDSEDSMVPDSEDGESGWTSDSSSLPCIELRPDVECPVVRRFPSLKEYLPESREGCLDDYKMRECTVRVRRLEPGEIDALTNGRSSVQL